MQPASLLLRRARLLREQLARVRRRASDHQPITSVARAPDVQIETAPGDARPEGAMLMRDFLSASLYDPVGVNVGVAAKNLLPAWRAAAVARPARAHCRLPLPPTPPHNKNPHDTQHRGYFSRPVPPVGRLPEPIDFSKLVGQAEYRSVLARAHSAAAAAKGGGSGSGSGSDASAAAGAADAGRLLGGGDWLTPSEIFRPWYGAAVAHYVLEAHALEQRQRRQQQEAAAAAEAGGGGGGGGDGGGGGRNDDVRPVAAGKKKRLDPIGLHEERQPLPGEPPKTQAAAAAATSGGDADLQSPPAAPPTPPSGGGRSDDALPPPPLYVVEIGGGTGALALSILDHVRDSGPPGLYERTTYVCVEVSEPLAAAQRSAVAVDGGHARAFVSVVGDAAERATWERVGRAAPGIGIGTGVAGAGGASGDAPQRRRSPPPPPLIPLPRVYVLAMEVLDNLPHDRIERAAPGQPWLQTAVAPKPPPAARRPSSSSAGGWAPADEAAAEGGARDKRRQGQQQQQQWRQVLQPLTDPLVARCARLVLPLLAAASGGDPRSPSVLAGVGVGVGVGIGEDRADARLPSSSSSALASPTESPPPPPPPPPGPSTAPPGPPSGWGWDPASWLRRLLAAATGEQLEPVAVWLPTRALALADALHGALPRRHTLVASDFDALPGVQVEGHGAPIVSGRRGWGEEEEEEEEEEEQEDGEDERGDDEARRRARLRRQLVVRDHAGVLVPWGTADIFFPTDFDALTALYVDAAARAAAGEKEEEEGGGKGSDARPPRPACQHMPTADFMAAFAESKRTRTLSGYNPLLQDFRNTRFFVGEAR